MGLDRYGYTAEAQRLRRKWCDLCATVFAATGTMWEKYNVVNTEVTPEEGLYGSVTGFGWSNAVFVDFVRHLSLQQESLTERLVPVEAAISGNEDPVHLR